MTRKAEVTPGSATVTQAKASMVVVALFMIFGLVFGGVVLLETPNSEGGLKLLIGAFFVIWTVACIAIMIGLGRIAKKRGNALLEISVEESDDFAGRLRKLEELKRDGLISEAEYVAKRAEMLGEKW